MLKTKTKIMKLCMLEGFAKSRQTHRQHMKYRMTAHSAWLHDIQHGCSSQCTEPRNAAPYLRSLLSPFADGVSGTTVQVSHSSEEVLALKKEIARCQVEADKLRTAISMNKVCCCTHSWTRSLYPRGSLPPLLPSLAQLAPSKSARQDP